MLRDSRLIAELYTPTIPGKSLATAAAPVVSNQEEQTAVKKEQPKGIKDWIRLPFIRTPFQARMAAVLIVELINNMTSSDALRELVLKEIRTNNRLHRKR